MERYRSPSSGKITTISLPSPHGRHATLSAATTAAPPPPRRRHDNRGPDQSLSPRPVAANEANVSFKRLVAAQDSDSEPAPPRDANGGLVVVLE